MDKDDDTDLYCARLTAPLLGTVLDEVIEKAENFLKRKVEYEGIQEKALFVVGSKSSGKTTLIIDGFGLNEEEVRPTLALDFFCALQVCDDGISQKMCNIWELAGGTNYASVLNTVKGPKNLTAAIMLDLSSPNALWHTAVTSLDIYHKYIANKYTDKLERQKVPESHKDKHLIHPFPIPLFFIGGKYDLFQEFEPEKKRVICQCLRYLAHVNYGFLFFYSSKLNNVSKSLKEIFSNHFFGTPITFKKQFEYNQPLLIPPGEDSLESIEGKTEVHNLPSMEKYKNLLNSYFKQEDKIPRKYPDNPRYNPNYKEPKIDYLRNQRDEILDKLIREKEMELKIRYHEEKD